MAFCSKCGSPIADGEHVCAQCGAEIIGEAHTENADTKTTAQFFDFASKILTKLGGKDITDSFDSADRAENMAISGFCYISPFFFLPLLACPKSKLARHHANSALLILIASLASGVIFGVISAVLGALANLLWYDVFAIALIFSIIGVIVKIISSIIELALLLFSVLNICSCLNLKVIEIPFLSKLKIIK